MRKNTPIDTLMENNNEGRYTVQNLKCETRTYVMCNDPLDVWDGQQWRIGRVQHDRYGYYFYTNQGYTCHLCAGQRVRVR